MLSLFDQRPPLMVTVKRPGPELLGYFCEHDWRAAMAGDMVTGYLIQRLSELFRKSLFLFVRVNVFFVHSFRS